MDDRIIDDTINIVSLQHNEDQILDMSTGKKKFFNFQVYFFLELNMSMIKRMMQKNLIFSEQQEALNLENEKISIIENENNEKLFNDNKNIIDNKADLDGNEDEDSCLNDEKAAIKKLESNQQNKNDLSQSQSRHASQKIIQKNINTCYSDSQGPDNQTLLRLLEEGEQLHSMFRCARIQGLDTLEGLLLFGKDYYYVVDGFTLLKTREIRDLDFLPEQFIFFINI